MRFLIVAMVAGCGRLGFDDLPIPDAVPNICDPVVLGALPTAATPTKVRATQLSTGHVVAVETDDASVHVARLANDALASWHLPFADGYTLYGVSQVEDRPFIYVFTSGRGYIKLLIPDWSTYETGPDGEQLPLDPQQALLPGGALALYGVIVSGTLNMQTIDATNTRFTTSSHTPAATSASFAASSSGVRVVVENAGECETFIVQPDGTAKDIHRFSPCSEPVIAAIDDVTAAVLHKTTGGSYAVYRIPAEPTGLGTTVPLGPGSNGRITVVDGTIWAAYLQPTGEGRLWRLADQITERAFPISVGAFELLGDRVFWVDKGELHAGATCTDDG